MNFRPVKNDWDMNMKINKHIKKTCDTNQAKIYALFSTIMVATKPTKLEF
jgi:hypothetical protein